MYWHRMCLYYNNLRKPLMGSSVPHIDIWISSRMDYHLNLNITYIIYLYLRRIQVYGRFPIYYSAKYNIIYTYIHKRTYIGGIPVRV